MGQEKEGERMKRDKKRRRKRLGRTGQGKGERRK